MKATIEVTQAHIDAGVKRKSRQCPVALAMKEHVYDARAGLVDLDVFDADLERVYRWFTPDTVMQFILDFDKGRPVKPFTFELEIDE